MTFIYGVWLQTCSCSVLCAAQHTRLAVCMQLAHGNMESHTKASVRSYLAVGLVRHLTW